MTDLINKVNKLIKEDADKIEKLLTKYREVLAFTLPEREHPYHAFFINYCVNVINKNHENQDVDWKAWACVIAFKLYQENKIKKLEEIPEIISDFFEFKEKEYEAYCNDTISVNDYERDRGFVYRFYFRKK